MDFFVGLHQLSDAQHFDRAFISVNRLLRRKSAFKCGKWIMDSGAFGQLYKSGDHMPIEEYAKMINKFNENGDLLAVVAQDYVCEPDILRLTGRTVREHQILTIEKYVALKAATSVYVMPVIQGYEPEEYAQHVRDYGDLLEEGMYVGVGTLVKRSVTPYIIIDILRAIKRVRPDLRLHGFGIKLASLRDEAVREMLESCDSMAWSFTARREGRDGNDWREAKTYEEKVNNVSEEGYQISFIF